MPARLEPTASEAPRGAIDQPAVRMLEPFTLVIFGATGELTARKLIPAMYQLYRKQFLARPFVVVGVGRRDKSDGQFRAELLDAQAARNPLSAADHDAWMAFANSLFYHRADFTSGESYPQLAIRLTELEAGRGVAGNRLFYLATDPDYFPLVVAQLASAALLGDDAVRRRSRVVVEKPFGKNLESASQLEQALSTFVNERQIYRIDHYLGKETVQNLVSFRFGNAIFEPLFNRRYVDHVQIAMAEADGVSGRRGAFYDNTGALRDVVQNHLLQLLALVVMEPPASLGANDIHDEKVKVLRNLVPFGPSEVGPRVVRGQYGPGAVEEEPVRAYRQEEAVATDSSTETYVALRAEVDTWRWAGVPFFLRAGKRLPRRVTEIAVEFKRPPLRLFTSVPRGGSLCDRTCSCGVTCECCNASAHPSVLTFRIQPDEGISLSFGAKRPGMQLVLKPVNMDFQYERSFSEEIPEAYERLLLDALRGDQTLFTRSDEVTAAWEFITPILEAWQRETPPALSTYGAGSWGPPGADSLLAGCPRAWRQP